MTDSPSSGPTATAAPSTGTTDQRQTLTTLFDLGRQVTAVLDLGELLRKIPELIRRLIDFEAFAVYLVDSKRGTLRIAYSVGYPDDVAETLALKIGEGLVGVAVGDQTPLLVNDVSADRRYVDVVPGVQAELAVPLRFQGRVLGALSVSSRHRDQFSQDDLAILRQFGAHVAVALANAQLFEQERKDARTFETLAEIGREVASILDLDELLARIAHLVRRVIDYRTFGILLLNERTGELEMRLAVKYGSSETVPRVKLGEGLVGYAALHKQAVLVPDVSVDRRYINLIADVRSELVVPILSKDRCLGVFDLQSPELNAFDKRYVPIMTLLASQAAVAIENARLYEKLEANERRLRREVRFAQRVQAGLLRTALPQWPGVEVAARFEPARELGGDFYEVVTPEPHVFAVAVGDVSGKGAPAALYGAFAGELVRGRTFRRRFLPDRSSPAGVLASVNTILHERQLEGYYCTLSYALFDFERRTMVLANSGLPYPVRCSNGVASRVELPGIPLGMFPESTYDQVSAPIRPGDVYAFCTDGVLESENSEEEEFGATRLMAVVERTCDLPASTIVDAIYEAVEAFHGGATQADDMTVVVLRAVLSD